MRKCLLGSMLAAWMGTGTAYDPEHPSVAESCRPLSCWSTWSAWGEPVTLPCSSASGHFPLGLVQLPLMFEGNYDLCRTFENAHFCKIQIDFPPGLFIPLFDSHLMPTGVFPLGPFRLDQCVSKSCDMAAIKHGFEQQILNIVEALAKSFPSVFKNKDAIENAVKALDKGFIVTCSEALTVEMDGVGVLTVLIFGGFFAFALVSTIIAVYVPHVLESQRVIKWFAMNENGDRLMATIPGDFNALNGIRFLSMCWVITGHTILSYSLNIKNPNAQAQVVQSFPFVFVRGAEYAVDTFFFMSGFLATWGMVQQFQKRALTLKSYGMLILGRFLRLTPTYLLVVLYFWKVLPSLGEGPNWDQITKQTEICDSNWYYNFLYVNNIFPWGNAGAMTSCAGWTWYLANDFQFFLLSPILAQLYLMGFKSDSKIRQFSLKYLPCLSLFFIQLVSTIVAMFNLGDNPAGNMDFQDRVYTKPWCRVSPYAVGIALALLHFERTMTHSDDSQRQALLNEQQNKPLWKILPFSFTVANMFVVTSIVGMLAAILPYYWQWRCEADEHECNIFMGQFLFGFFRLQNWSKGGSIFFYSICYLLWSVPLAVFCYFLFCDDSYDLLHIKWFLEHHMFTPMARLTYNAYLIHLPIIMYFFGHTKYIMDWNPKRIALESIGFIFLAYLGSFFLYLFIEKPVMNMTSLLFHRIKKEPAHDDNGDTNQNGRGGFHLPLDRQFSSVSDIDSESVHLASPVGRSIVSVDAIREDVDLE